MIDFLTALVNNEVVIIGFLYMVLELWLGKTNKIKSNSVLELVWKFLKVVVKGKKSA